MVLAQLHPWTRLIPLFLISLLINTVVAIAMIVRTIIIGPKRYFSIKTRRTRPAILDSPDLGQHGYARLSEVTLHYVANGPEKAPLLLFVHGFPDFFFSWRFQLKEFGKKYRAVAIDMRGYGDSSKPSDISSYYITRLAKDIKELVHHLGYEKCVLAGHDWGASVAWNVSFQHPEVVEKLIILNLPHPAAFQKHLYSHWSQMKKSWYMFFFQFPVLPETMIGVEDLKMAEALGNNEEEAEAYKWNFLNYADRRGPINYYRAALRYAPPKCPVRVSCPVLLLWGVKDKYLEKEPAEKSNTYCDNTFKYVAIDAGHWVHTDAPEEVNKHITEFLQ